MRFRTLSNSSKVFFAAAVIILTMAPAAFAWAAPVYDDLNGTKVFAGKIKRGALRARVKGAAGDHMIIEGPFRLRKKPRLAIKEINIRLKKRVAGTVIVRRIPAPPNAPPNAVGFFKVNLKGFGDQAIAGATITFRVGNKLVNVRLSRLHKGAWTILKTVKVENGVREVKYRASSPGFSTFAIIAEPGLIESEPARATGAAAPSTSRVSLYLAGLLGIVLVGAGAAVRVRAKS